MLSSWDEHETGSPRAQARGKGREVLVVDDHTDTRETVGLLVKRLGWPVRLAASGEEALALLAERRGAAGVALLDVMLPDTDGMSLARRLRGLYPQLAIVMMSGQLNDESRWIVSEEGFRFLPKPFSAVQLRDMIAETLGDAEPEPRG